MNFQITHGRNLEKGILKVRHDKRNWGTGFLVADQYIITNCHCLPRLPDPRKAGDDHVYVALKRFSSKKVEAESVVIYADPCGDIAILQSLDSQSNPKDSDKYDLLLEQMQSIAINTTPLKRLSKKRVYVRSDKGHWISGEAGVGGLGRTLFVKMDNNKERMICGTSGSPVFDETGLAIGILKFSPDNKPEYTALVLPDYLPVWLLDRIKNGISIAP